MRAFIGDAFPDYTSARIILEANSILSTVFPQMVVDARGGYWLDAAITTTTAGRARYRIPGRAVNGGLEKVEIADASGCFWPLTEVGAYDAGQLEGPYTNPTRGFSNHYVVEGDQVHLLPSPDNAYALRMRYYRRPSRLVAQQSSTLNSGVVRGQVSAVNPTARTITVNVIPFDQEAVAAGVITPAALVSGTTRIDVIHPDGWHELALTGVPQTYSGTTITVGGSDDMSAVELGDWVRAAEQSDWPQLPDDFHATLVDATAVEILTSMDMPDKASALSQRMGADLARFKDLLLPRVKDSARIIKPTYSYLHRRRRNWVQA
jgi:hypothetical protein